jgi:hypothetical protein
MDQRHHQRFGTTMGLSKGEGSGRVRLNLRKQDLGHTHQLRQLSKVLRNPSRLTRNRARCETNIRPTTVARRMDSRNRHRNTRSAVVQELWGQLGRSARPHRLMPAGASERFYAGALHSQPA